VYAAGGGNSADKGPAPVNRFGSCMDDLQQCFFWRSREMRIRILALVVLTLILMASPATSHAFGLMRWMFDGVANQLGLDRGPIPKVVPNNPPSDVPSRHGLNVPHDPNAKKIYIQAEGF